jgi:hypothetical protein
MMEHIAVIGAGYMGGGIAQVALSSFCQRPSPNGRLCCSLQPAPDPRNRKSSQIPALRAMAAQNVPDNNRLARGPQ